MVDLLLLTVDRADLTRDTLLQNLRNAGHEYRLYHADNGSADGRVIEFVKQFSPVVQVLNKENRGIAPMLNVLLKMSTSPFICTLAPDILLPDRWLDELVKHYNLMMLYGKNPGGAGIHTVERGGIPTDIMPGITVDYTDTLFGNLFLERSVFNKVGYFNETYGLYGIEDADYNYRLYKNGFTQFYLHGLKGEHIGHDWGQETPYRKLKTESLAAASQKWGPVRDLYDSNPAALYIPADGKNIIDQVQFFGEG